MLIPYFLILLWVTGVEFTQAFATQVKHHAGLKQLRSFPCPNAEDIAPCKCEYKRGQGLSMVCDNIKAEQELHDIFHSRIPFPHFNRMYLNTSTLESLSENVFGDATFTVFSTFGKGMLEFVDPKVFIKSTSTLKSLSFVNNNLSSFPFDTLGLYKELERLSMNKNPISSFPTIESQTLSSLRFCSTLIKEVPANALDGLNNLQALYLSGTKISKFPIIKSQSLGVLHIYQSIFETIPAGALDGLPHLTLLFVGYCPITSFPIIESKSLRELWLPYTKIETIQADALVGLPKLQLLSLSTSNLENMATGLFTHMDESYVHIILSYGKLIHLKSHHFEMKNASISLIFLKNNQISTVDVDTFEGVKCGHKCYIDMRNNLLTTLPEAVWRPLIEAKFTIKLEGNILTCGCDVAWLVLEPSYHEFVADARCHNGQLLVDLDSQIYEMFC